MKTTLDPKRRRGVSAAECGVVFSLAILLLMSFSWRGPAEMFRQPVCES